MRETDPVLCLSSLLNINSKLSVSFGSLFPLDCRGLRFLARFESRISTEPSLCTKTVSMV